MPKPITETDSVEDTIAAIVKADESGEEIELPGGDDVLSDAVAETDDGEKETDGAGQDDDGDGDAGEEAKAGGRDEKGRFKKKDGVETETGDADAEKETATDTKADTGSELFSADEQELLSTLKPSVREFLTNKVTAERLRADAAVKKAEDEATALGGLAAFQGVDEVMAPMMEEIQRLGYTPAQALKTYVDIWQFSRTNPLEYMQWFMTRTPQMQGVTKEQVAQALGISAAPAAAETDVEDDDWDAIDPRVQQSIEAIRAENQTLKQQLEQITGNLGQIQTTAQQREQQAIAERFQSDIDGFATAADDSGKPLHPYFDRVREKMAGMITAQIQQKGSYDLQELYDFAVHTDPVIRAEIEADRARQRQREEDAAAFKKSKAARLASTPVSGTPGKELDRAAPDEGEDDPLDTLQRIMREQAAA